MNLDANAISGSAIEARDGRSLAVVAVTRRGTVLAARLIALEPDAVAYVPERWLGVGRAGLLTLPFPFGEGERRDEGAALADSLIGYGGRVAPVVANLFRSHRALVLVMAAGAAVRLIAPLLRSKTIDPAVVIVDDAGRFAISLLSGHVGGANRLTERIAATLGAQAVITTASESAEVPPADLIGSNLGWRIEPGSALTTVAAALVNGEPVGIVQDAGSPDWLDSSPAHVSFYPSLEALAGATPAAAIVITDHEVTLPAPFRDRTAIYHPPTLVLGIGCSRGVCSEEVGALVLDALHSQGLSEQSVTAVATIDRKADEEGLLEFVRQVGWPLVTYTAEQLAATPGDWQHSPVVGRAVGVEGVAEPAALRCAGAVKLLVPKLKSRRATVAVARIGEPPCETINRETTNKER